MSFMPYDHYLKEPARTLRKSMTSQEKKLWYEFLRGRLPRFLRQKPLGRFIVDFYCPACKLALEIDGGQHYEKNALLADKERTAYLASIDVAVMRFSNLEVDREFPAVCQRILDAVNVILNAEESSSITEESF